jgi:hypothetical protein
MDKESLIELQKIDCNCSDCIFMVRDIQRYNRSLEDHHRWQLDYFNTLKNNLIKKAKEWRDRWNDLEKYDTVHKMADKMRFQFDRNEAMINYGQCSKFNKPVSFIPNTCQLETQNCFEHRRAFTASTE